MKLNVQHDTTETVFEPVVNGIKCDYCPNVVSENEIIRSAHFDQAICEECWGEQN